MKTKDHQRQRELLEGCYRLAWSIGDHESARSYFNELMNLILDKQ